MSKVRRDMLALSQWCKGNGISMNTGKLMVFGSATKLKKLPTVNIKIDGVALQSVSSYKYLGIMLDSQLNYGRHVNNVISNASLRLRQLRLPQWFTKT